MSLEKPFERHKEDFPDDNWLDFLTGEVLDVFTYDGELDNLLIKPIVDVLNAIVNRTTFLYQNTLESRLNFVIVCHLPYVAKRIDWGTSIRGAWPDGEKAENEFKEIIDFYNTHKQD